ncbi:MAG: hypothetical protein [Olavius algarvensis Gamma 1 endosymbiont]|nr:MAG: hypothetical protein [Olavius algarvensis Gamma 1 endosymbiont]
MLCFHREEMHKNAAFSSYSHTRRITNLCFFMQLLHLNSYFFFVH